MPVYIAIAGQDSLAGGQGAADVSEVLSDAQVQTWEHATHSLPMQEADQLQIILTDFWDASETLNPRRTNGDDH